MRYLYKVRCVTCGADPPRVGDQGCLGLPSLVRSVPEDYDPTFGVIYAALAGVNLLNEPMDTYFTFLQQHRSHRLEMAFLNAVDEPERVGPWKAEREPRLRPEMKTGYSRAFFTAKCERCGRGWSSTKTDRLRRFEPARLSEPQIATYFHDVAGNLGIYFDNRARPLTHSDLDTLGSFLYDHKNHQPQVALADKRLKLPVGGRRPKRGPKPAVGLEDWRKRFEDSGWRNEVEPEEADRMLAAAREWESDPSRAYYALSRAGFDAESIENDGDYARVLSAYHRASYGAFQPSKVKDRINRRAETVALSFKAGGRCFARTFSQASDWVADGLHDFLNEVLEDLGSDRRFFMLPTGDQTAALVCVTPATWNRAIELGLVPERAPE